LTYQVAYREWKLFCESFGRRHDGARVRVELLHRSTDPDSHAREVYAADTPLQQIQLSDGEGSEYVVITVGERPARSFVVRDPSAIVIEPERGRGGGVQLRIDSRNRTSMILRFLEVEAAGREDRAAAERRPWVTPAYINHI
jgi:hypothetical protein